MLSHLRIPSLLLGLSLLPALALAQVQTIEDSETGTVIVDSAAADPLALADSLLAPLDLSDLTTGLLVDRSLATWDYQQFSPVPVTAGAIPDTLPTWNHRYGVYLRNARTEADKYDAALREPLAAIDSLFGLRGLPQTTPKYLVVSEALHLPDPEAWHARWEQLREVLVTAATEYPNGLPRMRIWLDHLTELTARLKTAELEPAGEIAFPEAERHDFPTWISLYQTLLLSQRDSLSTPLPSPYALEAAVTRLLEAEPGVIPLVGLHLDYERLKPTAVAEGLLHWQNGQLHARTGSDAWLETRSLLAVAWRHTLASLSYPRARKT